MEQEDLHIHSPPCVREILVLTNKINSTKRTESTQVNHLQEQSVRASSHEFIFCPFHSICMRQWKKLYPFEETLHSVQLRS